MNEGTPNEGTSTALTEEVNEASGIMEAASTMNNSTLGQVESSVCHSRDKPTRREDPSRYKPSINLDDTGGCFSI